MAKITLKGYDKLMRKFPRVRPAIARGIKAGTVHIKGKIAKYPPATIANSSTQQRWYERGYGPRWRTRAGVRGRKTSENLGRKWTTKFENGGLRGIVGNNVTYGPYVQSFEKQAAALKRIGWQTDQEVADKEADTVLNYIKHEVDKALEG